MFRCSVNCMQVVRKRMILIDITRTWYILIWFYFNIVDDQIALQMG